MSSGLVSFRRRQGHFKVNMFFWLLGRSRTATVVCVLCVRMFVHHTQEQTLPPTPMPVTTAQLAEKYREPSWVLPTHGVVHFFQRETPNQWYLFGAIDVGFQDPSKKG